MRGPVSRNYNVILTDRHKTYRRQADGSYLLVSDLAANWRSGSLTTNNPWRKLKPPELTPTARTLTAISYNQLSGDVTYNSGGLVNRETGPLSGAADAIAQTSTYGTSYKTTLEDAAIIDALIKLKDQKFNAGVAIAEAHGVARMVEDVVEIYHGTRAYLAKSEWLPAYRYFRKKTKYMSYRTWRQQYWDEIKHVQSVRRAKKIPEGWLYYHYGILPTLKDLDGAYKQFIHDSSESPTNWNCSAHGYAKFVTNSRKTEQGHPGFDSIMTRKSTESVRCTLFVSPKNDMARLISTVGLTNLPEAAWNRTPFSFLFDYVSNIGQLLSVLDVGVGWSFGTRVMSYRRFYVGKVEATSRKNVTYSRHIAPVGFRRKDIIRTVLQDLYGPMGSLRPHVKLTALSATKWANILSLLATGFKKTVRP